MGQAPLERLPGLTCGIAQLRPYSRGHVRIVSPDPFAVPEIQPNYLADDRDCAELLAGMKFVRRLLATRPLADFIETETWPGLRASRARLDRTRTHDGIDRLSSGWYVSHGRAGRRARRYIIAGTWRGAIACDRRVSDAVNGLWKHVCDHDHDRREGRRSATCGSYVKLSAMSADIGSCNPNYLW